MNAGYALLCAVHMCMCVSISISVTLIKVCVCVVDLCVRFDADRVVYKGVSYVRF